jgi:hypothetical protein
MRSPSPRQAAHLCHVALKYGIDVGNFERNMDLETLTSHRTSPHVLAEKQATILLYSSLDK